MLLYVVAACMGSLNVMFITWLVGTLTALFTGLIVEMVGGVMSVELMIVKLDVNAFVRLFPAKSIISLRVWL